MEEVDRIAARVSIAAIFGLVSGASLASYKGGPKAVTALRVAGSFVLAGTACLGSERLGNVVLREISPQWRSSSRLYASHAFGGVLGGAVAGGLYQGWPLPGMIFFTPIMLAVAVAEMRYEEIRNEKLAEMKAAVEGGAQPRANPEADYKGQQ